MSLRTVLSPLLVALALSPALTPDFARAQTQHSLRIRSLGPAFGGILDDYLTDVYLNPARVSLLDRNMAYAVTYPARTIYASYPIARATLYSSSWMESEFLGYSVAPIGLSYFGRLGGSLVFSLGGEIDLSGDEEIDDYSDFDTYGDEIRLYKEDRGQLTDVQYYLLDFTLASTGDTRTFGARLRAAYNSGDIGRANYWERVEWDLSIPDRIYSRFDGGYRQNEHEVMVLDLALGLYKPEGLIRDLVLEGGVIQQTLDADSRDARGERWENDEYTLSSSYDENRYLSGREYTGYDAKARAHFQWAERVKSTHEIALSHSGGDGTGQSIFEEQDHGSTSFTSMLAAQYAYDGTTDAIRLESTVGYSNNLFENILFAFAVFGAYSKSEWEEAASGEARLGIYDGSMGIDTTFTAPYEQDHTRTIESYRLSIPMGIEWTFHKYGKLRIGVTLTASHIEDDRASERGAVELTDDVDLLSGVFNSHELNVDSGVDAVYLNGLEINVNDRLVVDLYTRYTYAITLWEYTSVSVRYTF